ncbi:MAG: diguanylate cyclase [Deltaproteobacteria bacterium]|nr:diguanylate cyclase [Deltaproteobacteria bacterium]
MKISNFSFFQTIRFKLLVGLFTVLTISIGAAMFGIWNYERDSFMVSIRGETMRAGRIIEKSLRTAMLSNNRGAIHKSLAEISTIMAPPSRVMIVAPGGRVVFSSDPSQVGSIFIGSQDQACAACHLREKIPAAHETILLSSRAGPILRSRIEINGQPVCYRCHSADRQVLGTLLFDAYVGGTFQMLRTVAIRTFLTGLLTFMAVILVMTWLITRLIHQPIQNLIAGFEAVGSGDFTYWVDIKGSDEFCDMATSFNVTSRAIGRYIEEIKASNAETSTLYSMLQRMSRTIKLSELTGIVFDLFYEFFGFEEIMMININEDRKECYTAIWRKKEQRRLHHRRFNPNTEKLPGSTLKMEELQQWTENCFNQTVFPEHGARVLIPLIYNNENAGIISIRAAAGQTIPPHEKRLIRTMASHIAISFANARLYHMATTDGLTGLFTKRFFLNTTDHMTTPGSPTARPFWLMMMDLDHFKEVNDTYGHPAGDQVLIQLADLIRANIRYGDIPCRYGGEEFIIILPESSGDTAFIQGVADRVLLAVANHTFTYRDCRSIRCTISIGIASFPGHAATAEEVIQKVDNALYAAKEGGRNRVCSAH